MNKKIRTAVIAAAGKGKRCYPISTVFPKEMFPIKNKPAIHYLIEEAVEFKVNRIIIVVSQIKTSIKDYVTKFFKDLNIIFFVQEKPLGLLNLINNLPLNKKELFYLMLGDEVIFFHKKSIKEIKDKLDKSNHLFLIKAIKDAKEKINYGMLSISKNKIKNFEEKPQSNFHKFTHAIIGRYFFDLSKINFKDFKEYNDLDILIQNLIKKNMLNFLNIKDKRFDISTPQGLSKANE